MSAALLALPLLPAVIGGLLLVIGRTADRVAGPLVLATTLGSALATVPLWSSPPAWRIDWLPGTGLGLGLDAAGVALPLATVVIAVSVAVVLYSLGFLNRDEARARFFGLMGLFVGAMLTLILAADLLTVLLAWELIGACSYGLIGFWHQDPERPPGALRAFVTTRAADVGLYLAVLAAWVGAGSLALGDLAAVDTDYAALLAGGLMVAALGKSAQLPFSGWLHGAMLGPTPVSALLHSATLVAAGPVLLLKTQSLWATLPVAAIILVWLGLLSALAGAAVALTQTHIKRLLAASTVSQQGYLIAGLAAGGAASGATHLANHAAFKALLFLTVGVVVRAHIHYLQRAGGLWHTLRGTALLLLIGCLALAPLPPLGGFFSKEALVEHITVHHAVAGWLLYLGGLLTAAYAARLWWLLAPGPTRSETAARVSRPGIAITSALVLLAVASLALAVLGLPPLAGGWAALLGVERAPELHPWRAVGSVFLVMLGAGAAGWARRRGQLLHPLPTATARADAWFGTVRLLDSVAQATLILARGMDRGERAATRLLSTTSAGAVRRLGQWLGGWERHHPSTPLARTLNWLFPELGHAEPGLSATPRRLAPTLAKGLALLDLRLLSRRLMDGSATASRYLAALGRWSDRALISRAINSLTAGLDQGAAGLSRVQNGQLFRYYLWMSVGAAGLLICSYFTLLSGG